MFKIATKSVQIVYRHPPLLSIGRFLWQLKYVCGPLHVSRWFIGDIEYANTTLDQYNVITQSSFTFSKLTIETLEQSVEYVQS